MDLNKLSRTLSKNSNKTKPNYMPLSFQGLGSVAILVMVLILSAAQGLSYFKERFHRK
jgi:hypothetical protein